MKTLFTITIAFFISSASFAQLTPGSYVLGGGLGFSFSKSPGTTSNTKSTSFQLSPGIGKFISEKFLLDGGLEYSYVSRSSSQQSNYNQSSTGHFFGMRFGATRFFPIVDRLYFTLGAHIIPSYTKSRNEWSTSTSEGESTSENIEARLNVAPGLSYFINRKWMLFSYVGVLNYGVNYNMDTEDVGHNLYLNLQSNSFGIGVRYVLGKGTNE